MRNLRIIKKGVIMEYRAPRHSAMEIAVHACVSLVVVKCVNVLQFVCTDRSLCR